MKVKFLGLNCLFVKKKFNETCKTVNLERTFSVLTFLSNQLQNMLAPNSLDKLIQANSVEPHIWFRQGQNNWFGQIPEKTTQHSTKLTQLNYLHLKVLKLKIYSSSLFLVTFFLCSCYLMTGFCYLNHSCFFQSF